MIRIKEGFKSQRLISLSDTKLAEYAKDPIIGQLYLRKIGFFPRVKYHFVQKPQGVDYAMLIYCTDGEGWCEIIGQRYMIRANQFIILPPGTPLSFGASEHDPWTIYMSGFTPLDFALFPYLELHRFMFIGAKLAILETENKFTAYLLLVLFY
ncbi:hypothetical protein C7120_05505 [Prevotella sp. oral taxon 376]|uniref:AraC family ligand binding domain-containing protein n=1 Tax=Prevotella sp. oral taxon 376 TaxID=712466 RepID=UPI000D1E7ED9|nr:AraC family ligand binding domain-containing protein [Prevotella sp. oral taxon 376]PTL34034.1 hypothetical protein C7120_05505 [Prevotella sp. oral taxon 376]